MKEPQTVNRSMTAKFQGSATPRYVTLQGEDMLVAPVVAMVGDSVVWGAGASGPEFVPSAVLAQNVEILWNGRPAILNHPETADLSANSPEVINSSGMGTVYNARMEEGNLVFDIYFSKAKAELLGGEALQAYTDIEAGKEREVSIGATILVQEVEEESYSREWVGVVAGDHIAILDSEQVGACSIETGCGTNRQNQSPFHHVAFSALRRQGGVRTALRTLAGKEALDLRSVFREMNSALPDWEIRSQLWDKLDAEIPGFSWIEDVFTLKGEVVFTVSTSDYWAYYLFTFEVTADDQVILTGEPVPVELVREYRPTESEVKVARNRYYQQDGDTDMAVKQTETETVANCGGSSSPETVTLTQAEYEEMKANCAFVTQLRASAEIKKEALVAEVVAMQGENPVASEAELSAWDTPQLETLKAALSNAAPNPPATPETPARPAMFMPPAVQGGTTEQTEVYSAPRAWAKEN